MNIKKITAFAAAVIMAAGICTGVPTGTENISPLAITAEAADSDFVTQIDQDGDKYIESYKGKGGDVVIPDGVIWIAKGVFAGNNKITSVTFPKSCYWIEEDAFKECVNLKKVVFEGDATICKGAFEWCYNLESVTVKGSISVGIYANAFYGCESLKTVKIAKNNYDFVIGGSAFRDCYSLTSINIPSKCTDIYGCAFLNCFSLTKLTIPAKTKINTDASDECHFGYAYLYETKKDVENAVYGNNSSTKIFVADGKTSGYTIYYKVTDKEKNNSSQMMGNYSSDIAAYFDGNKSYELVNCKKYTPKQLTVTVTKGSPAEKWAKANNVKYTYASSSSSSGSAAAPSNFKASKTNNSVTLSWDAVDGADLYRVYKYNDKIGKYEKYKDVKSTKCTVSGLSANTKYKFKVVSYSKNKDGKYVKGESSKAVSVTTTK